jgi:hypothetical protein
VAALLASVCVAQRGAVTCKDIADLALRNGHQRLGVNTILKRKEKW